MSISAILIGGGSVALLALAWLVAGWKHEVISDDEPGRECHGK